MTAPQLKPYLVSYVNAQYEDIHDQLVQEKDRVIGLLEFQNKQLIPISNQNEIMEKIIKLSKKFTIIFISHNMNLAKYFNNVLKRNLINIHL